MQTGSEPIVITVPWASVAEASSLASPDDYKDILVSAGFELISERNQRKFALEFFERQKAAPAVAGGLRRLGFTS